MNITKTNRCLFALIVIIFLNACNLSDNVIDLSGGYQLVSEGEGSNFIIGPQNINPNVVKYCYNSDFILVEQKLEDAPFIAKEGERLLASFENFPSNSQEKLNAIDSDSIAIYKLFVAKGADVNTKSSHKNVVIAYEIADSIIHSPLFQEKLRFGQENYYIIRLENIIRLGNSSLMGPLTKEEYQHKRKELNIPENLKLRSVDE